MPKDEPITIIVGEQGQPQSWWKELLKASISHGSSEEQRAKGNWHVASETLKHTSGDMLPPAQHSVLYGVGEREPFRSLHTVSVLPRLPSYVY